jgi:hypothetical protein
MDVSELATSVGRQLGLEGVRTSVTNIESRVVAVEGEFNREEGRVHQLQLQLEQLDARNQTSSSDRGGYIFRDQGDVAALMTVVKDPEFYKYFLDIISLLQLASAPFHTYEGGIKVHADSIKAQFHSLLSSRMKLSYQIPFPETILRTVDTESAASRDGVKWAPMLSTAAAFEDDFRTGAHRKLVERVEKTHQLVQNLVDSKFPLKFTGDGTSDSRKIRTIISVHNRIGLTDTLSFLDSISPFNRTVRSGGLPEAECWERTRLFVSEALSAIQEVCCVDAEMATNDALIWGSMKATDLAEQFRANKWIEDPKICAILAITSLEREGLAVAGIKSEMDHDRDVVSKVERRVQSLENKEKELKRKNPELK